MISFKSFLVGFSIGVILTGSLYFFLEKTPTFFTVSKQSKNFYYINLEHLFFKNNTPVKPKIEPLKGIVLKGLYFNGKTGFVILSDKKKTIFLDLDKSYKGYKLIKIGIDFAIFYKNGKEYKLTLRKKKVNSKNISINEDIKIDKKTFLSYKNNLPKIWHNIGIIKTKEGYKITYLNKNSIFYKIGLRKGDIILEVNGKELKNDADAWQIYKESDNFDVVEVKLKRNNEIKVIDYEID